LGILVPVILRFLFAAPIKSYARFVFRQDVVLAVAFIAAFCLEPALTYVVRSMQKQWRNTYTYGALLGTCAFLWVFILHFGRQQYGSWDFNILVETGWRQIQGQRPYVDFQATTPPGFNLGIQYAYRLFGVNWDANLYLNAIFACLTFLWIYWLMVLMEMGRLAAAAMALAIECAAMLALCIWWFNDSVMVLAAVFFLSCLAYEKMPKSKSVQVSYVLSLMLLSLMKPNMAGVTIVGGVVLLFLVTERKIRLALLTLAATAMAVGILLVNHVSIPAMLASYISVVKDRGNVSGRYGFRKMSAPDLYSALCWIALLSMPLFDLAPKMIRMASEWDWKRFVHCLFFPMALIIALYGLMSNSDWRNLECTVLLAAGAVLTFGLRWNGPLLRRVYIAIMFASIAGDLYYGAARARVYGIGPHMFFEWQDNQHRIESGFLKNMRVSSTMIEVERELKLATTENAGPYFFGPRLDFNYATLGLPSPEYFPAVWDPGTAFVLSEQAHLIQGWQEHKFQTLIFLKIDFRHGPGMLYRMDYTYYPKEFLDAIDSNYVGDDVSYPLLIVYHRRAELGQP
jgi:hypothetical protein